MRFVAALFAVAAAVRDYTFEEYLTAFGKSYSADELVTREALFNTARAEILAHNANPSRSFEMGFNALTDATDAELSALRGRAKGTAPQPVLLSSEGRKNATDLPKEVDWRKVQTKSGGPVLSAVKNQGACGSCWAHAATEVVESHLALATGVMMDLSQEHMLSCVVNTDQCGGKGGCAGATSQAGFQWILDNGGMSDEWNVPYLMAHGPPANTTGSQFCPNYKDAPKLATIESFETLPLNDAQALMEAVQEGPVAISVDARAWSKYNSGIFDACDQESPEIDHAVVLVGYGEDDNGNLWWTVRNSWGPTWGENGFIRVRRNWPKYEEPCGIDTNPLSGNGCPGGPKTMKVCGVCGIVSDSSTVKGAKIPGQDGPAPHVLVV